MTTSCAAPVSERMAVSASARVWKVTKAQSFCASIVSSFTPP